MSPGPGGRRRFSGISVVGRGTVAAVPDLATFWVSAVVTAGEAGEAMSRASTTMQAMIDAARADGVADADLQSQSVQLSSWRESDNRPLQYHASQRLQVRIRTVATAGTTLERVLAAGGNTAQVDRSALSVAEDQPYVDRARELAMADARRRAEQLARLADRPLGDVLAVHEDAGGGGVPYPMDTMSAGGAKRLSASAPVESGELEVSSAIAVDYGWGD
jgi:uncharacterized protein YggE